MPRLATLLALALAQEPEGAPLEVVVSARGTEEAPVDAARAITVVDADAIAERQPRSLVDALREAAGVTVQETHRGAGSVYVRGLIGPQNLLVVDGLPVMMSTWRTGPNQALMLFDPTAASRIEIVRGPSSMAYGNGAMGGVIHLLLDTATPTAGAFRGAADARASFASADLSGLASGTFRLAWKKVAWTTGGSVGQLGVLRTGGDALEPLSDYRQVFGRSRLTWTPASGHTLDLTWMGGTVVGAGRTDAVAAGDVRTYDSEDHLVWLRYGARSFGPLEGADVRVGWHRSRELQDRGSCPTLDDRPVDLAGCLARDPMALSKRSERIDTTNAVIANADARLAWLERRVTLRTGADAQHEAVDATRRDQAPVPDGPWVPAERGNFASGSTFTTAGAFLHLDGVPARLRSGRGELHLTGSARVTHVAATSPDVPQPDAQGSAAPRPLAYNTTGVVGAAGLQWRDPGRWSAFVTFQQGFRAPNLEETTLLGPEEDTFSVPNPGLRPERSDTVEGGLKLALPALDLGLVGYGTWINDALVDAPTTVGGAPTSPEGLRYSWRENRPGARYVGVEAQVEARWRSLALSGHVTWTQGDTLRDDGEPEPARRVPPVSGRGGLRWQAPGERGHAEAFVLFAGPQDRLSEGDRSDLRICAPDRWVNRTYDAIGGTCPGTPGWVTVNLRGSVGIPGGLRLDLALLNVGNVRYRTHGSGFDAAGFDARIALSGRW